MKLRFDQLENQLRNKFGAIYLVSGDEPLQLQEAAALVRQYALKNGFSERRVIAIGNDADWAALYDEASALSLFAERKLIELRLNKLKIGDAGAKAIAHYLAHLSPDNVLLLVSPRVDADTQRTKWFKALDAVADHVAVWPIELPQIPGWIRQRMQRVGLQPTAEAAQLLAERVEGNLLAAVQEIEKLGLLKQGAIDVEDVLNSVADSAKFDVFGMVDSCHQGDLARFAHILDELKNEGVAAPLVLWALTREIRVLATLAADKEAGVPIARSFEQNRIWDKRKRLIGQSFTRKSSAQWRDLLRYAVSVDKAIKHVESEPGNPWDELLKLGAMMTNQQLFRASI